MYVYIWIYIYVYLYIYIHIYVCIYIYMYIYSYICIYIYVNMYIHIRIYVFIHGCVCLCVHKCVWVYLLFVPTYMCIYIYIHAYKYKYTHIYIYILKYIYTYIHVFTHTYIHIHIYIYTYIYMCIHIYIHMHIRTYTHPQTKTHHICTSEQHLVGFFASALSFSNTHTYTHTIFIWVMKRKVAKHGVFGWVFGVFASVTIVLALRELDESTRQCWHCSCHVWVMTHPFVSHLNAISRTNQCIEMTFRRFDVGRSLVGMLNCYSLFGTWLIHMQHDEFIRDLTRQCVTQLIHLSSFVGVLNCKAHMKHDAFTCDMT